jgi:hypothetical protein
MMLCDMVWKLCRVLVRVVSHRWALHQPYVSKIWSRREESF